MNGSIAPIDCKNYPDASFVCANQGGEKVWKETSRNPGTSDTVAATCPQESVPWRTQFLCSNTGQQKRYSIDGERAAVCVVPISETPLENTPLGKHSLHFTRQVSYDREMEVCALDNKFTPCYVQPFALAKNAMLVAYVPHGDEAACREQRQQAIDMCVQSGRLRSECSHTISDVYDDVDASPYVCALDASRLPVPSREHDKAEWWRWVRHTHYDCRASGWKCDDTTMREYSGGTPCADDKSCATPVEFGVCDLPSNTCTVGSKRGAACVRDEDCDTIGDVIGGCEEGRCSMGKIGVSAAYHVPKTCNPKSDRTTAHDFCGRGDDGKYAGICTAYDFGGQTYHGCRAFESEAEIADVVRAERRKKTETRRPNEEGLEPWELLTLCPDESVRVVNGQKVCLRTSTTVHADIGTVHAKDVEGAALACEAKALEGACVAGIGHRDERGRCVGTGAVIALAAT